MTWPVFILLAFILGLILGGIIKELDFWLSRLKFPKTRAKT